MNLIVTVTPVCVSFVTHTDYSAEECKLFLESLVPWLRERVTCSSSYIYAEIPIKVINDHLPYGKQPVRFLWDILVEAHYHVVCPPVAY